MFQVLKKCCRASNLLIISETMRRYDCDFVPDHAPSLLSTFLFFLSTTPLCIDGYLSFSGENVDISKDVGWIGANPLKDSPGYF